MHSLNINMNLERAQNILLGVGVFLISGGMGRTVCKESNNKIDKCAKAQLGLGFSATSLLGALMTFRALRN